jgi:long-chain acyl-CoA synthetase
MVGSAPAEESMLRAFRELGIELHNAYGLTEAPLITLNRLGANHLGTVGAPLPETQVRIANGEIIVRGPQVAAGYAGPAIEPLSPDGWLVTGDLGHLTGDGCLVVDGRKKELIATSYGKKVFPAKVEAMLRALPGVTEAMLVGEQRPFCAAILWTTDEHPDEITLARLVEDVNTRLARPEQVRRWVLLPYDLSIGRGDLTANLKLRRRQVESRLSGTIEALYAGHGGDVTATDPAIEPALLEVAR